MILDLVLPILNNETRYHQQLNDESTGYIIGLSNYA